MFEYLWFLIGLILASIFYYKTDNWRIRKLRQDGYDAAIRDIIEFNYYYDTNNNRVNIIIKEINNEM